MKRIVAVLLILVLGATVLFGCGAVKYNVDYCGQKQFYHNAKDAYRPGTRVTVYYYMIGTDTDYSFFVDGERINYTYKDDKGFEISFIMPDHNVTLRCESRNSMEYDPSAYKD